MYFSPVRRALALLFLLALLPVACKRGAARAVPAPSLVQIHFYNQFPPGTPLNEALATLNPGLTAVRYRRGLPDKKKSAVYFFEEGDLHIDAVKSERGWVLSSVPYFEPSKEPAVARLKKWDGGAESKEAENDPSKYKR